MSGRLAVLCDYPQEGWPSMDLCAEMLLRELGRAAGPLEATRLCPPYRRRAARLPALGRSRWALNADRLLNRFVDFPRAARAAAAEFDLFHLVDHSYSQALHVLPPGRCGVLCHDLETFRCILEPARDPRPAWFRAMARRILSGLQRAAVVFHTTAAVGEELTRHGLVDPARLVRCPLGPAPEFFPEDDAVPLPWQVPAAAPYLLHVGSCIPRKRIDLLLEVFAALRVRRPDLRLVKVGGPWAPDHLHLLRRRQLEGSVIGLSGIPRATLARLYRRAALVLQPSDLEGFGLPVLEALACGARVLASDIPAHREVAGDAAALSPAGDLSAWVERAAALLDGPEQAPPLARRLAQAASFSWARHAEVLDTTYRRLLRTGCA